MNHITLEQAEALAHRRCKRYVFIDTEAPYQFNGHTLMDFVRDIEAAAIQHYIDSCASKTQESETQAGLCAESERQVPDGWQLVPTEATPEMVDAGVASGKNRDWSYTTCYRAMLAAAPQGDSK